ncbi:autotransporter outer membrane beta-barrel domain-containing protein [Candidatus Tisiphia endosymbiont of Parasteatoda lunata]|uniref:autotransporter outer membrane beta-barrel domain-containing protein n=1 Tax=Candidatus Tisiphia endosymbiont of Parasteatoda lunata TaxID=3066275 RepID=UPI00313E8119
MSYKHQYLFLTCAILFITFNVIAITPDKSPQKPKLSHILVNPKAKKKLFPAFNNTVDQSPKNYECEKLLNHENQLHNMLLQNERLAKTSMALKNLLDNYRVVQGMKDQSTDTRDLVLLDDALDNDKAVQGMKDQSTDTRDLVLLDDALDNDKAVQGMKDQSTDTRDLVLLDDALDNDKAVQGMKDQSTDTRDLVLLDDALDNDSIVKLEREKYENVDVTVGNMEENNQLSGLSTELAINRDLNQLRLLESINQFKANYEATMISLRMHHQAIQSRVMKLNDEIARAVAAGDEKTAGFGIWGSSGFAVSKQGRLADIASYKAKMLAVIIGVDIELNDNDKDILGIAYSNVRSMLRFSEALGKSRINSHVVSIYSQKDLGRNVFLQSVGSISGSTIKKRMHVEKKGKSYTDSIRVEGNVSYRHACTSGIQLVPTIGLRYCHMQGGLYHEQGPYNYFLKVSGKYKKVLSGTIGSTVILNAIDINPHLKVIPTLQGSIERSFLARSNEVVGIFTSNERVSQEIKIDMPRASRLGYNIGAGIIVQSNNIKLQFSYNYHIQKKYKAHEGVVKLKLSL